MDLCLPIKVAQVCIVDVTVFLIWKQSYYSTALLQPEKNPSIFETIFVLKSPPDFLSKQSMTHTCVCSSGRQSLLKGWYFTQECSFKCRKALKADPCLPEHLGVQDCQNSSEFLPFSVLPNPLPPLSHTLLKALAQPSVVVCFSLSALAEGCHCMAPNLQQCLDFVSLKGTWEQMGFGLSSYLTFI